MEEQRDLVVVMQQEVLQVLVRLVQTAVQVVLVQSRMREVLLG
jgi:hypothetical protein